MKLNKPAYFLILMGIILGIIVFGSTQYFLHKTSDTAFCVSCHSMVQPKEEWEGSHHFSNRKGIRAECANCHVPNETLHYLKAKFIALKDIWYEAQGRLSDQEKYESHRLAMAKRVWNEMKENDSMTCKSCHSIEAMILSEQSKEAQKMHKLAQSTKDTCIDCHKGIVHFMPDITDSKKISLQEPVKDSINAEAKTLYTLSITTAQLDKGGEVRLMPYAELTDWKNNNGNIIATIQGWQQIGAESIVYAQLGQRITVAVLGNEEKEKLTVLQTIHDKVTDSQWREVTFTVTLPQNTVTDNIAQLNQLGEALNQTHCSGCHSAISADHYTANQWIGVVNSMKDRTTLNKEEVRKLTIYLQRNAKDSVQTIR